ncbi:aldose-1-epimerase [Pseudomonas saudimassiliensis]|uniref:Putative glucose-6-phosphate 1-epimerase n=1 Tax=Pseudomonas saudimassiliensis TaxID=1461581 RepID=A0A078MKC1_9PSED|nr:D-hexose-6-phosphate mutarotase [Pseudomonas saudimassiliensis]CEA05166.1 aldose-1-epimerase [Pseudomonas saudimassiliensis]CEF26999.1 aldose-1-epimerase [Pseudomonas saudimassiliensis]
MPQQTLPAGVRIDSNNHGRQFIHIEHSAVQACIALQGAHIIDCTPAGQQPLLWMSPIDPCLPDTALRGGVPVCWPWFADERSGPAHGIARTGNWQLHEAQADHASVRLVLRLSPEDIARQFPDEAWAVEIEFRLGKALDIALTTTNTGRQPQRLSQALHSYLPVADIDEAEITGLRGCAYIDKLSDGATVIQSSALRFAQEVDRIYFNHGAELQLHTGNDLLSIRRDGSMSVVVWNPWQDKSARLSQFPADGYRTMVCVEAANAGPDGRILAPGETHTLRTVIGRSVEG